MPIFTSQPIRTIRIEPQPDVGAFYDRDLSRGERQALLTAGMIFGYIAAQLLGWL